jgi:hypothetical protein
LNLLGAVWELTWVRLLRNVSCVGLYELQIRRASRYNLLESFLKVLLQPYKVLLDRSLLLNI